MMQLLEAAGIEALTDHQRQADQSNKKRYHEHNAVAGLLKNTKNDWLLHANGKSLKVIVPLLASLPMELKQSEAHRTKLKYRVISMNRDINEILHSQYAMLKAIGKDTDNTECATDVFSAYSQQVQYAKQWCLNNEISAIEINYNNLALSPKQQPKTLSSFLSLEQSQQQLLSVIHSSLYRSRSNTI